MSKYVATHSFTNSSVWNIFWSGLVFRHSLTPRRRSMVLWPPWLLFWRKSDWSLSWSFSSFCFSLFVLPDQKFQKSPKEVAAKIAIFSPHFFTNMQPNFNQLLLQVKLKTQMCAARHEIFQFLRSFLVLKPSKMAQNRDYWWRRQFKPKIATFRVAIATTFVSPSCFQNRYV